MENPYELRLARETDQGRILGLIRGASTWLATKGTDQWQEPWPDRRARDTRVRSALRASTTWILMDGDVAVGTITAEGRSTPAPGLPELWNGYPEPAVYVHRMVVRRANKYQGRGIGGQLLDAMSRLGAVAYGAEYLRLDAWTANDGLHGYYRRLGFAHVRTYAEGEIGCPSGALFQRPVETVRERYASFTVRPDDEWRWRAQVMTARDDARNHRKETLAMEVAGS